jgi:SAM-dependent methyltransferase
MHHSEYEKIYELESDHWWFEGRRRLLRHFLRRFAPAPTTRILDIGCGTGHTLVYLKKLGYEEAAGVDMSALAIDFCTQLGLSNVKQGDALALDYPDGAFDTLLAFDVIEHLRDDRLALCEFHRVLRPGGVAIVTVPAFRALWSQHDVVLQHYRRYRAGDLKPLARSSGLKVDAWSYFYCTVFPLVALMRFSSRLLRSRRTSDLEVVPRPVNAILKAISGIEVKALGVLPRLPFGTSLAAVLRKPDVRAGVGAGTRPRLEVGAARVGEKVVQELEGPQAN